MKFTLFSFLIIIQPLAWGQNLKSSDVSAKLNQCLLQSFKNNEAKLASHQISEVDLILDCEDPLHGQGKVISYKFSLNHFFYELEVITSTGKSKIINSFGWGEEKNPAPRTTSDSPAVATDEQRIPLEEQFINQAIQALGPMPSQEEVARATIEAKEKAAIEVQNIQQRAATANVELTNFCSIAGPLPPGPIPQGYCPK